MRSSIEIVVPVHNAQHRLEQSITRLHRHTRTALAGLDVQITIADAASTDLTGATAMRLADRLRGVRLRTLERPGRGHALRQIWSASRAELVAYTDVELATDLMALAPLTWPLLSGEADITIGSRLVPGAEVERALGPELGSRIHNLLLWRLLGVRVADAQCAFKAARRTAVEPLLQRVENEAWFFDTELLYLAERAGLRILELPVRWRRAPDSSAGPGAAALESLREIRRLRHARALGRLPAPRPRRPEEPALGRAAR